MSPQERRFWWKVAAGPNGCILWVGARQPSGYGNVRRNGRYHSAHRLAYEDRFGAIPDGLWIDHLCKVKSCVNPLHLEAVEPAENNRRAETITSLNGRKIKCKRGHELSGDNLAVRRRTSGRTSRVCRTCENGGRRAEFLEAMQKMRDANGPGV